MTETDGRRKGNGNTRGTWRGSDSRSFTREEWRPLEDAEKKRTKGSAEEGTVERTSSKGNEKKAGSSESKEPEKLVRDADKKTGSSSAKQAGESKDVNKVADKSVDKSKDKNGDKSSDKTAEKGEKPQEKVPEKGSEKSAEKRSGHNGSGRGEAKDSDRGKHGSGTGSFESKDSDKSRSNSGGDGKSRSTGSKKFKSKNRDPPKSAGPSPTNNRDAEVSSLQESLSLSQIEVRKLRSQMVELQKERDEDKEVIASLRKEVDKLKEEAEAMIRAHAADVESRTVAANNSSMTKPAAKAVYTSESVATTTTNTKHVGWEKSSVDPPVLKDLDEADGADWADYDSEEEDEEEDSGVEDYEGIERLNERLATDDSQPYVFKPQGYKQPTLRLPEEVAADAHNRGNPSAGRSPGPPRGDLREMITPRQDNRREYRSDMRQDGRFDSGTDRDRDYHGERGDSYGRRAPDVRLKGKDSGMFGGRFNDNHGGGAPRFDSRGPGGGDNWKDNSSYRSGSGQPQSRSGRLSTSWGSSKPPGSSPQPGRPVS